MSGAISSSKLYESWMNSNLLLQCGKTYPALFPVTLDEILQQPSPRFGTSGRVTSRGLFLTHSIGEWRSGAVVCSLSQILEENVPQKYYLSPRAARGILRRAEKRGKELPTLLRQALQSITEQAEEKTAFQETTSCRVPPAGTFEQWYAKTKDLGGTREEWERLQEMEPIAFDRTRSTTSGDIAGTLRACGAATPGVNDGKADARCVAYGVSENQRAEVKLTPYSRQITSGGGKPGQGYPCVAFAERTRKDGRNLEVSEELSYALTNPGGGGRAHSRHISGGFGVRRLTPTECERLQAFPDGWTGGQKDTPRYRQLGNAVCVNVVEWLGHRILEAIE